MTTYLATLHANTLSESACKQIATHCHAAAGRFSGEMTVEERAKFRAVGESLDAVLALQDPDVN